MQRFTSGLVLKLGWTSVALVGVHGRACQLSVIASQGTLTEGSTDQCLDFGVLFVDDWRILLYRHQMARQEIVIDQFFCASNIGCDHVKTAVRSSSITHGLFSVKDGMAITPWSSLSILMLRFFAGLCGIDVVHQVSPTVP